MNITSPKTKVKLPAAKLFETSSNCQNFAHLLSEQAKDISATEDTCSFTVDNIAKITLKILDKTPLKYVRFVAENDKNIPLFLTLNYTPVSDLETDVEVLLDIELPVFLKPIIQKPLERFVNELSRKIQINAEKNAL
jgi:hypothetical protein